MSGLYYEISEYDPPSQKIRAILENYKTVAIVGLSPKPERDSHKVAKYLKQNHYRIVPVNPGQEEILGETCYPNLKAIPFPVDVVECLNNVLPGLLLIGRRDRILAIEKDIVSRARGRLLDHCRIGAGHGKLAALQASLTKGMKGITHW